MSVQDLAGNLKQKFLTVEHKRHYCMVCQRAFQRVFDLHECRKTERHRRNFYAHKYAAQRAELIHPRYPIAINLIDPTSPDQAHHDADLGLVTFKVQQNKPAKLTLQFKHNKTTV